MKGGATVKAGIDMVGKIRWKEMERWGGGVVGSSGERGERRERRGGEIDGSKMR